MAKRIGILGENPVSTIEYFEYINNRYYELFKDHRYPEIVPKYHDVRHY